MSLKYIGGGFIPDIPARDISDEEIRRREIDKQKALDSGLYKEQKRKPDNKSLPGASENKE